MRIKRIAHQISEIETENSKIDLLSLNEILRKHKGHKGILIPILQETQELFGYIPEDAFKMISAETNYSLSQMYGVATFYSQFRLHPVGKHVIKVCHGTACHVQNADSITTALSEHLKVDDGKTTPDNLFTLESVACLGCCSLAPVMMIDGETYGKLDTKSTVKVIREIKKTETNNTGN
jgi:NADH-quinone oxidoreductase subunit E